MPLDNKISNIIGAKLPQWVLNQLSIRSYQNTRDSRDNNNILYLANKTAWVRLVSSINIVNLDDQEYFKRLVGEEYITDPTSLAKEFILFGGTSKYLNKKSYQIRSGIGKDGAYGILGDNEIKKYGYKPMPGITSVNIETQGRLGSVRAATVNFKCWDKSQLDIIDALYFKLGYTMFLEWGHTYFYPSEARSIDSLGITLDPSKVTSTEFFAIDPFQPGLSKEKVFSQIAQNSRQSEGNYDAMLGMVTNFNFTYTQDGGYDCTLRIMSLGVLGDSIKINNAPTLPDLLQEQITRYNNTLAKIQKAIADAEAAKQLLSEKTEDKKLKTIEQTLRELSSTGEIKGTVIKITPSSPEKIVTTSLTVQEGNKTVFKQSITQEPTGEFAKPDTVVRTKDGERYIYITRIGQVVKYDSNASYDGFIDIDQLDTFRSNLIDSENTKIGKFLSNLVLQQNTNGTKVYAIGSVRDQNATQFKIVYKTKVKDDKGNIGEIEKYITFEFTLVDFTPATGTNLINDSILPAIRLALDNELEVSVYEGDNNGIKIDFRGEYEVNGFRTESKNNKTQVQNALAGGDSSISASPENKIPIVKKGTFKISTNDTSIIKDIFSTEENNLVERQEYLKKLNSQNQVQNTNTSQQTPPPKADPVQTKQAITSQSAIELILRAIEVKALDNAITAFGLDLGKKVRPLELYDQKNISFLNSLFSTGVMASFIKELAGNYKPLTKDEYEATVSDIDRFKIHAKYGFATSLLGNKEEIQNLKPNNYKETLIAYAVPYEINQEIQKGTSIIHPVYIPFSLLLMILNHSCTIYDTKKSFQTPLVYIDYNNNLNFFLSNSQQLSTNPFVTIIPYEGTRKDFTALFDDEIIEKGTAIKPISGSSEFMPIFNTKEDALSSSILKVKSGDTSSSVYRGKVMNILLNVEYIIKLIQDYSYKDGSNNVYLKPFLEQILSDVNKYLGDFNAFRLSYNDQANTFQIVDDQFIPSPYNEEQVQPNQRQANVTNRTEIPLFGKSSIAKTLEIKTDISNRLANMIAISSNSTIENKATLSTNGDTVGYVNTNFIDRYIVDKLEVSGSNKNSNNYDTLKIAARHFNQTVKDFYSTVNPSEANVSDATNYYIEKMSKVKNDELPTRSSTLIPVSINFTTDGISGLSMGQAFTVHPELLPYTYTTKKVQGMPKQYDNNMGFVMVGLNHNIEGNSWNTTVRANMIFLKDKTLFNVTASAPNSNASFTGATSIGGGNGVNPNTPCGCERCPPGAYPKVWNEKKQEFERQYSCADQVDSPESVNTSNFGNGKKYYSDYKFVKGTSDINLSKANLQPLKDNEIADDTAQNRFLIGTITTNPDERVFVVHHTAGNPGAASGVYTVFYGRGLPAQYVIDGNAKIHRFMPDGARGWHAGDYNPKSIGVEITANNDSVVSQAQVNAAVRLIHYLGFKKSQVVGHGEIADHKEDTEGKKVVDAIRNL